MPQDLREALEKSLYRIQEQDRRPGIESYEAANPGQDLRATFTRGGVQLSPRTASSGGWQWSLSLRGYGYGERIDEAKPASLAAAENRIEYRRGPLTEWYLNGREGLEQGFTVAAPPAGRRAGEPLVLVLRTTGDLQARPDAGGQQITFVQPGGEPALSYGKLAALDARGVALPARMRASEGEIRLEVADGEPAYPVTIDPLVVTETKLTGARHSLAWGQFGYSVAISGDTAVVGAPHFSVGGPYDDAGSAYVFVRSGATWTQQAQLFPSDGAPGDAFGFSVAISGDTIVVGAYTDDTAAGFDEGSAYVFVRNGTVWSEQAHLFGSHDTVYWFGCSVAISGDTVVVGKCSGGPGGSAYVFVRSGTLWSQQARLTSSLQPGLDGNFGFPVAISGDTVVVGAAGDAHCSPLNCDAYPGSVHVFVRSGSVWSEQAQLYASDYASGDQFGRAVAISGDTIVVGAYLDDTAVGVDFGSAYVFVRNGSVWSEQAHLFASDAAFDPLSPPPYFGYGVGISGDTVVVGNVYDGTGYVFVRNATVWTEQAHVVPSDGTQTSDKAAGYLAISGDTVIIGAWGKASGGAGCDPTFGCMPGAAYVYQLTSSADLALSQQASASTVPAGQNVTYTLLVTNNGPGTAPNVVVTDNLPSSETLVSCVATQGGVCGGTGNNRTISFASLAAGASATITLVSTVNCNVPDGASISNPASVTAGITDNNPSNNTASAVITASNPVPTVNASVATGILWPAKSSLVNVGLAASVTDNCGTPALQVQVFGDEDDETPTSPGVVNSPDAKDIALSTLRLRAERVDGGDGRVYLIVVKATDSAGGVGFGVQRVVVPMSKKAPNVNAVNAQAAAARAYALANNGNPPPGYVVIGDGPVIGPKQ